jgi:hypothetical protein
MDVDHVAYIFWNVAKGKQPVTRTLLRLLLLPGKVRPDRLPVDWYTGYAQRGIYPRKQMRAFDKRSPTVLRRILKTCVRSSVAGVGRCCSWASQYSNYPSCACESDHQDQDHRDQDHRDQDHQDQDHQHDESTSSNSSPNISNIMSLIILTKH